MSVTNRLFEKILCLQQLLFKVGRNEKVLWKLTQLSIMGEVRKQKVVSARFFEHITNVMLKGVDEVIGEVLLEGLIFKEDSTL